MPSFQTGQRVHIADSFICPDGVGVIEERCTKGVIVRFPNGRRGIYTFERNIQSLKGE